MADLWSRFLKFLDHNRNVCVALVIVAVAIGGILLTLGCQSRAIGLSGGLVTRSELDMQVIQFQGELEKSRLALKAGEDEYNRAVAQHNQALDTAYDDLDRQDEYKAQLLEAVSVVALQTSTGGFNIAAVLPLIFGLIGSGLGLGAAADNRRKDKVITTLKNGATV